jgi:hypothetical protein
MSVTAWVKVCYWSSCQANHTPQRCYIVMLHAQHCTAAAIRRPSLPPGHCARRSSPQLTSLTRNQLFKMEVDRPQAANGEASTSGKQARNFITKKPGKAIAPFDRMLKQLKQICRERRPARTTTSTRIRTLVSVAAAERSLARHAGRHSLDGRRQRLRMIDQLPYDVVTSRHAAAVAPTRHVSLWLQQQHAQGMLCQLLCIDQAARSSLAASSSQQ